ncbi:MAG: RNA polymerase sigma factor [Akkermansiaceae bacterium]
MSQEGKNFPKKTQSRAVLNNDRDSKGMERQDSQNFEAFIEGAVSEFESPLIGYARTYLHDLDRSRDVVQDTFIRLCRQKPDKVRDHLKSWLFTVCRNRCLDVLRKDKRIEPIDEIKWKKVAGSDIPPDEQIAHDDKLANVMKFLDRLPKNQKEVILLKFQQGMSYKEIQKVTGLKQGNIGFLIHTGLKRVREWLPEGEVV